ncbi:MAG: ABC transporter permease [Actinomycetota bacterium]
MLIYILRRVLYSIPILIIATFLVFVMVAATFDPTTKFAQSQNRERLVSEFKEEHGLNRPLVVQYGDWLSDAVRGDFGESYRRESPVADEVKPALWNTMQLAFFGVLVSSLLAVAVGVFSAVRQYSVGDYVLTGLAFAGIALPTFWFGLIAYDFAIKLARWFNDGEPVLYGLGLHSSGEKGFNPDYLRHLVLPVTTLTVQIIASWSRFQRAAMLDVLGSDYVRTARAKGVPRRQVVTRHALRNALIPLVTIMALDIGALFGGLVITEQLFSIPGMGRLFVRSLGDGDVPIVLAWLLIASTFIILFNLLADLLYSVLDPRIRLA